MGRNSFLFSQHLIWIYYSITGAMALALLFIFNRLIFSSAIIFIIPLAIGIYLLLQSWLKKDLPLFLMGTYLSTIYSAIIIFFFQNNSLEWRARIAYFLASFILALILIVVFMYFRKRILLFWTFPIFILLCGIVIVFFINNAQLLDYFFFIGIALGIAFLGSGLYWKLFGLVIPGSLLIGSAAGVYFAWARSSSENALVQTGVMLVWIALGWGMVTIFSRMRTLQFLWWPLIPGGIFAMVGWGLYIGGNPKSAVGFIGNTGSIGLLIFGIYILLLRRGIHR